MSHQLQHSTNLRAGSFQPGKGSFLTTNEPGTIQRIHKGKKVFENRGPCIHVRILVGRAGEQTLSFQEEESLKRSGCSRSDNNSDNLEELTRMVWRYGTPLLVLFYTVRWLQTVVGVTGNTAVLITVPRIQKTKTNAHILMWTLAWADLLSFVSGKRIILNMLNLSNFCGSEVTVCCCSLIQQLARLAPR